MSVNQVTSATGGLASSAKAAAEAQIKFTESVEKAKTQAVPKNAGPDASGTAKSAPKSTRANQIATPAGANIPSTPAASGQGTATGLGVDPETGARVYLGPVKVNNEIEGFVEQKTFIEAAVLEASGAKYKPGSGWLTEFKAAGTATESRLQAGYKFTVGEELVSAPNNLEFASGALGWLKDTVGIGKGSVSLSTGYKSEDHVVSSSISWKKGPQAAESNANAEKLFAKASASLGGDLFNKTLEINSEAEVKSERKTAYGADPGSFKGKWDATPLKLKLIPTNFGQSSGPDMRVLTNGQLIDRKTPDGKSAYQDARFVSPELPDNGLNFYMQKEVGGASNLAVNVPNFDYQGDSIGSETVTLTQVSRPFGGLLGENRSDALVARLQGDPDKISRIEAGGRVYVPVDAVADWLQHQGAQNPALFGDLQNITPDILVAHNEGRVKEIDIEDSAGTRTQIRVFDEGDVINTGYAAVEQVDGVVRTPNLENGASRARVELFWDQFTISLADNVEPGSVGADGSIDRTRLISKTATYGFGGVVDTVVQTPLGLVEGGARLAAGLTEAGKNPGNDWINGPATWTLNKAADGIGWANDRVGDVSRHFTDQLRVGHNYTLVKQPTEDVLAPAANEIHAQLTQQAKDEGWSEVRLERETGKLINQYNHQVLQALETGRIPSRWDASAPSAEIPDLENRIWTAMRD